MPCSGPVACGDGQRCLRWSHTLQDTSGGALQPQLRMILVIEAAVRERSMGWSDGRSGATDKG